MPMLRGIPAILPPGLVMALMEMGHGDEVVLADGNFPAAALARRLVRCDGHTIEALLEAIMPLFPLDHAVEKPASVMTLLPGDPTPAVWARYRETIKQFESGFSDFEETERFAFYERAGRAYVIVATGDRAFKGNLILKKGVIRE